MSQSYNKKTKKKVGKTNIPGSVPGVSQDILTFIVTKRLYL